jgi:hypothetical protein
MDSFSPVSWVIVLVYVALVAFPLTKILRRTGNSGWWAVLAFIPLVNLAALWAFAFVRWPIDKPSGEAS